MLQSTKIDNTCRTVRHEQNISHYNDYNNIDRSFYLKDKTHTNWWGRQNAAPLKFDPKPSEATFSGVIWNCDKCQPKLADNVISSVPVDSVGMDDRVKFGDSMLNRGLII